MLSLGCWRCGRVERRWHGRCRRELWHHRRGRRARAERSELSTGGSGSLSPGEFRDQGVKVHLGLRVGGSGGDGWAGQKSVRVGLGGLRCGNKSWQSNRGLSGLRTWPDSDWLGPRRFRCGGGGGQGPAGFCWRPAPAWLSSSPSDRETGELGARSWGCSSSNGVQGGLLPGWGGPGRRRWPTRRC